MRKERKKKERRPYAPEEVRRCVCYSYVLLYWLLIISSGGGCGSSHSGGGVEMQLEGKEKAREGKAGRHNH